MSELALDELLWGLYQKCEFRLSLQYARRLEFRRPPNGEWMTFADFDTDEDVAAILAGLQQEQQEATK